MLDFTDRGVYLALMSGKMVDFTDRKVYLALMSGKMLDFTDRKFYLALMSGEMDSFADGCKTTGTDPALTHTTSLRRNSSSEAYLIRVSY